jgi:small ubiquitin-related modifier
LGPASITVDVFTLCFDWVPVLQEGNEVYFKIKRSTPLRKLMDAYCQRQAKSSDSIRFLYDGARVMPDSTPEEVHHPLPSHH